ncbi:MAG TPA: glycine/sarcosine/betaine reductase complex component C subunit beta [Candidatus Tectomicrobia bacterium]|nr:glycine/sarcosine/betaine reductase complex component C subunit beta [Candidatus Tectomicrobia bacterium]
MPETLMQPVVRGVRFFLAHAPGLVRYGSKPARELAKDPGLLTALCRHLRTYEAAAAYPPNQVFLGSIFPDELRCYDQPWFKILDGGQRWGPHGEIMPEEEFYGVVKMSDAFDLVRLDAQFTRGVRDRLARHPHVTAADLSRVGEGLPPATLTSMLNADKRMLPLYLRDGRIIGGIQAAHDEDASLAADVLLENLVCKAAATMAFRTLLAQTATDPSAIGYVLNSGEEAVGDRYQRGGGNLAKAVAEMCGCALATGSDIKGFCCGPVHALALAGALIGSRMFQQVAVVGGCSLAKLGMKFQGHLKHDQPILEDVLAGVAILVGEDDGRSPIMRLDSIGRHTVGAGSSQQAIFDHLVGKPLQQLGLRLRDVDKYATELHNPEVTEPAGSGNVPLLNYRLIAGLAAIRKEITPAEVAQFATTHGMPGFSPTQGHIASAIPFLGHALDRITAGTMKRAMFLAKGSLFLGRMTKMADGLSFILESQSH